jgi:hypothetical protein
LSLYSSRGSIEYGHGVLGKAMFFLELGVKEIKVLGVLCGAGGKTLFE